MEETNEQEEKLQRPQRSQKSQKAQKAQRPQRTQPVRSAKSAKASKPSSQSKQAEEVTTFDVDEKMDLEEEVDRSQENEKIAKPEEVIETVDEVEGDSEDLVDENPMNNGICMVKDVDEYGRVVEKQGSMQNDIHILTTLSEEKQFKAKVLSLDGMLEYTENDTKEKVFEVSLLAEVFKDMLLSQLSSLLFDCLRTAAYDMEEEELEGNGEKKITLDIPTFVACCYFDKKKKGFLSYDELMNIFIFGGHVNSKAEAEFILKAVLENKKLCYMKLFN